MSLPPHSSGQSSPSPHSDSRGRGTTSTFLKEKAEKGASQVVLVVKNPPANVGDIRDVALIPGSGRFPGGGHSNPFQYSCLENPMDRRVGYSPQG